METIKNDINYGVDAFSKLYMIRQDILHVFYGYRYKERNDLLANILFNKDDDEIFFPKPKSEKWKVVARNKLHYMKVKDNEIPGYIKQIEDILSNYLSKPKYNFKYEFKLQCYKDTKTTDHIFTNNYDSRIKIRITDAVYNKLKTTIKKEYKPYFGYVIFLTMLRYEVMLNSRNHQLGIIYNEAKDIDGILLKDYDIECFASPINRTLPMFCGAYPDIDKYYIGSLGSFFNLKFISNKKYTVNPPYIEELMYKAMLHLEKEFSRENVSNIKAFITIPIWDSKTLKDMGEMIDETEKMPPYKPYEALRESKYLVNISIHKLTDYKYKNHLTGEKVSAAHTFIITLQKK